MPVDNSVEEIRCTPLAAFCGIAIRSSERRQMTYFIALNQYFETILSQRRQVRLRVWD